MAHLKDYDILVFTFTQMKGCSVIYTYNKPTNQPTHITSYKNSSKYTKSCKQLAAMILIVDEIGFNIRYLIKLNRMNSPYQYMF